MPLALLMSWVIIWCPRITTNNYFNTAIVNLNFYALADSIKMKTVESLCYKRKLKDGRFIISAYRRRAVINTVHFIMFPSFSCHLEVSLQLTYLFCQASNASFLLLLKRTHFLARHKQQRFFMHIMFSSCVNMITEFYLKLAGIGNITILQCTSNNYPPTKMSYITIINVYCCNYSLLTMTLYGVLLPFCWDAPHCYIYPWGSALYHSMPCWPSELSCMYKSS